jgi:hypothetical protein
MDDPKLFGPHFPAPATWASWRILLSALFGLPLTRDEVAVFQQCTGRTVPPSRASREAWLVVGRRGGKSRIAALVAVFLACFRDYRNVLAPGERGTLPIIAADRRQARTVMRYVRGLLNGCPILAKAIVATRADAIELANGVILEVHTASFRAIRGYTLIGAVCDELAFWRSEESANPDVEIVNALRPAMATVPGALLLAISSPYARRGVLFDMHNRHFGQDGDPILVWQAGTRVMNPSVDPAIVDAAYAEDPAAAAAEYGAEFRRDVEAFLAREAVDAVVVPGRRELPPVTGVGYMAFVDPSGGSHDAMTLAIAHAERGRVVLDVVRDRRPPFGPDDVVAEFAATLAPYRVRLVHGDRYGGEWPRDRFRAHGIEYQVAEWSKSDLYATLLPAINSRRVELLDDPRLLTELCGLERRVSRGGRHSIDHAPRGHDDLANACAGAVVLCLPVVGRPYLARPDALDRALRTGRTTPFGELEFTRGQAVSVIRPEALDGDVEQPRAVHLAVLDDAAAVAVGYALAPAAGAPPDRPPEVVLEALVAVSAADGGDVLIEDLLGIVDAVAAHVPIRWVTADRFGWAGPRRQLAERGWVTGELAVADRPQAFAAVRAALYAGRLRAYDHPRLRAALGALEEDPASGVVACRLGEAQDRRIHEAICGAVAGVVHVLVRRVAHWAPVGRRHVQRPSLRERA